MLVEALIGLERAVVLVLGVVVFACSFASGDSDVFLMKKTPFYRMMRHKWRRKSLFTATKKYCRPLQGIGEGDSPSLLWCQASFQSTHKGVDAMVN